MISQIPSLDKPEWRANRRGLVGGFAARQTPALTPSPAADAPPLTPTLFSVQYKSMSKCEPDPLAPCYTTMPPGHDRMAVVARATVIEEMRPLLPAGMERHVLDFGLHTDPQELKQALQETIACVHGTSQDTDLAPGMGEYARTTL